MEVESVDVGRPAEVVRSSVGRVEGPDDGWVDVVVADVAPGAPADSHAGHAGLTHGPRDPQGAGVRKRVGVPEDEQIPLDVPPQSHPLQVKCLPF